MTLLLHPFSYVIHPALNESSTTPYIAIAFLRDVSHAACGLFNDLLDELRKFIRAPRKPQVFRDNVNVIALHLGMLYRTIEGDSHNSRLPIGYKASTGSQNAYGNYYINDYQNLISRRLFPKKDSALKQLREVGLGFGKERFHVGCNTVSSALPLISLKVSRLEILLPFDSALICSSEYATIIGSPPSLASFSTTNEEETIERSSHSEHHKVIRTVGETRSDDYDSLLSTEGNDIQEIPAVSAFARGPHSERTQALSRENTRILLKLLQAELDEVRREIDVRLTRKTELENLIELTYLSPNLDMTNDTDTKTGVTDFNHDPNFHLTPRSPTREIWEVNEISQMAINESFEAFVDYDMQSSEVKPPSETQSKRVRCNLSASSKLDHSLTSTQPTFIPDSEAAFTQAWHKPSTFKKRNRLSRILLGQLSALQVTGEGVHDQGENEVPPQDPDRPASYPQTQRWRKSFGVSVKALRERFERLSLLRKETRDSQPQSMVMFRNPW